MTIPFHAIAVHFAISFTALWFFFELLARSYTRGDFRKMADWLLGLGILATGTAVLSGFYAESQIGLVRSDGGIIPQHKLFGTFIFCGMMVLGIWRVFVLHKNRVIFHLIYLVVGLLIVITLYHGVRIGSHMVYVHGVGIGTAFSDSSEESNQIPEHANFFICPFCSVVRTEPGNCPKCRRKLQAVDLATSTTQASQDTADSLIQIRPKIVY